MKPGIALLSVYEKEGIVGSKIYDCAYGENGWQSPAALYTTNSDDPLALDKFSVLTGVPGYNTWCDVDRLLQTMTHIAAVMDAHCNGQVPSIAVGGKHGNPCGAAYGSWNDVIPKMVMGDKRAIFGGFVMVNFGLDEEHAEALLFHGQPQGKKRLLGGVIAPSMTPQAQQMLQRKGDKCKLLVNPALEFLGLKSLDTARRIRYVRGGFLAQPNYTFVLGDLAGMKIAQTGTISRFMEYDLLLAWAIGSCSNSNTVTLVDGGKLIGNGVGQQDRVGACELAIKRARDAGHEVKGSVAYSDSFFPFTDGPQALIDAGVSAILTSSGSVNDSDVKKVCADNGVALYMVPDSIGRGFYGH